jgi:hypothetical protein
VLNLVGSFVLAVIAWVDERWGFLLLEGVVDHLGDQPGERHRWEGSGGCLPPE